MIKWNVSSRMYSTLGYSQKYKNYKIEEVHFLHEMDRTCKIIRIVQNKYHTFQGIHVV